MGYLDKSRVIIFNPDKERLSKLIFLDVFYIRVIIVNIDMLSSSVHVLDRKSK